MKKEQYISAGSDSSPLVSPYELSGGRGAGVAIPVFSLRSATSGGVGEFVDLKKMVDWVAATGQKMIQILPINDTTMSGTWEDSYPYNANSIFALHPQYISLHGVGKLRDKALQAELDREAERLNELPKIDYKAVNTMKNRYLRQLYIERGEALQRKRDYKQFVTKNSYWLDSYALFSLLRDRYDTADFSLWGDAAIYSEEFLARYMKDYSGELGYYYFVQYHLHCQLLDAHQYATEKGVGIKGDIPIGVSRTSVDVWVAPQLFRLDSQAGAPPDDFAVLGQNWGFPTYNWEEMARDGYSWWQARFRKMAEYFDAYRIDHILGFFRIWEIPLSAVHGLLGYFNPALPLSAQEIVERYGFPFDASHARPDINDWLLREFFGDAAQEIAQQYLMPAGSGKYIFKEEYNTQAKVVDKVAEGALCDSLLMLSTELLFIEDSRQKGLYHPRISAQNSYKYRALCEQDKRLYDGLYNDFYYCRHNDFWREEALKKLPTLIRATDMLTCGEDLGMIPACVAEVMEREQILSLEIQRMPKDPALLFGEPWRYPYRSVCTTSTHDMNPIRAWLREDRDLSTRYFKDILGVDHTMGDDVPASLCELIIRQHIDSPAMWTILPLQDWLSIDEKWRAADPESERINVPANSRHYWRYRMHCTLEELLAATELNERIAGIVAGR